MGAADVHLLAVDDVIVAVAPGGGLGVGQIGAGFRLGEELPGANFTLENLGQEFLLLLLGTPHKDGISPQASAGVVVRWERQVVAVDLLFQHHGVIDGQAAAAVFLGRSGPQPTLFPQLAAQIAAQLVLLVGEVYGVGRVFNAGGDVFVEPFLHLGAECLLLSGITGFKVHDDPRGRPEPA